MRKGTPLWKSLWYKGRLPWRYSNKIEQAMRLLRFRLNELHFKLNPINISKKNVLLIANLPDWAWDIKSRNKKKSQKKI